MEAVKPSLDAPAATRQALGQAVSGVLAAIVALADLELIVIGGPWGAQPAVLDAIAAHFRHHPRHVPLRAAALTTEPSLAGARSCRGRPAHRHCGCPKIKIIHPNGAGFLPPGTSTAARSAD